jgi:hypothetical protein
MRPVEFCLLTNPHFRGELGELIAYRLLKKMNLCSIIISLAIAVLILIESRFPVWAMEKEQTQADPR